MDDSSGIEETVKDMRDLLEEVKRNQRRLEDDEQEQNSKGSSADLLDSSDDDFEKIDNECISYSNKMKQLIGDNNKDTAEDVCERIIQKWKSLQKNHPDYKFPDKIEEVLEDYNNCKQNNLLESLKIETLLSIEADMFETGERLGGMRVNGLSRCFQYSWRFFQRSRQMR